MKTLKFILPTLVSVACLFACNKDKTPEEFYYGTWNVREQQYTSPDTTLMDVIDAGVMMYKFKSDKMVGFTNVGIASFSDTWSLKGQESDSIIFANHPSWQIVEKNGNSFKAKYYTDASSYFMLKLQK